MYKRIDVKEFEKELRSILLPCVGDGKYASIIASNRDFLMQVKEDVELSSAWMDEGYYNDSDIRLGIGRVLIDVMRNENF